MSVLIKGMEMPKNCSLCQFCFGSNNICPWTREYATSTKRHPDCPLVPAANVVERKKGEWEKGVHAVECSACSEKFYFPDDVWVEDFDICKDIGWNYCPNCGVDMRGDE